MMQRRLDRQSMCEGKKAFVGQMQAKHAAHFQRDGYCAYFCPFCHFWHIGGSANAGRAIKHAKEKERLQKGLASLRQLLDEE